MTILELRKRVYRRIGQPDFPDSEVADRILAFMNVWNRRILSMPVASKLRFITLTQASVSGTAVYAAPQVFNKIRFIYEQTTTHRRLIQQTEMWYRTYFADPTLYKGHPQFWIPLGVGRVAVQPSAAAALFVKSTSAGDTATLYFEVIRTGGYPNSGSVVLTGATAVSLGLTDIIAVVDLHLSAAAVGTVTLHQTSGTGTELARIAIGSTNPKYLMYALAPTPSSAITYFLDGIVDIVDFTQPTDTPMLPEDFQEILSDAAVYEELKELKRSKVRNVTDSDIREARADLELRIKELKQWLWDNPEMPFDAADRERPLSSQFAKVTSTF